MDRARRAGRRARPGGRRHRVRGGRDVDGPVRREARRSDLRAGLPLALRPRPQARLLRGRLPPRVPGCGRRGRRAAAQIAGGGPVAHHSVGRPFRVVRGDAPHTVRRAAPHPARGEAGRTGGPGVDGRGAHRPTRRPLPARRLPPRVRAGLLARPAGAPRRRTGRRLDPGGQGDPPDGSRGRVVQGPGGGVRRRGRDADSRPPLHVRHQRRVRQAGRSTASPPRSSASGRAANCAGRTRPA